MGTVSGITPERAQEIEDASVVSGHVFNRNLYLTTRAGAEINAGVVVLDPIEVYFEPLNAPAEGGDVSLSDTPTPITPTLTATAPTDPAVYLVRLDVDLQVTATSDGARATVTVELVVDGVAQSRAVVFTSTPIPNAGSLRQPMSSSWVVTGLAPGAHTFRGRASRTNVVGTTNALVKTAGTQITVLGYDAP